MRGLLERLGLSDGSLGKTRTSWKGDWGVLGLPWESLVGHPLVSGVGLGLLERSSGAPDPPGRPSEVLGGHGGSAGGPGGSVGH